MDKNVKINKYAIDCLKSAIAYCKQQYLDSGIDWLPSTNFVDSTLDEAAKFDIAEQFLNDLVSLHCITDETYTTYIAGEDKTIIWYNTYFNGELLSSEVVGWYYGEPDAEATKRYGSSNLTAYFVW